MEKLTLANLACVLGLLTTACAETLPGRDPVWEDVKREFASLTVDQAAQKGYHPDGFCIDAASLGLDPKLGAMGFHSLNHHRASDPQIDPRQPEAIVFDGHGKPVALEWEKPTSLVSQAPLVFGQQLQKMPAHPGMEHDHWQKHRWFIPNPNGEFADFNPDVTCPPGSQISPPAQPHQGH